MKGLVSIGYFANSIERVALGRYVYGSYNTLSLGGVIEAGHSLKLGSVTLTPFAGFQFDRLQQPEWSESNRLYGNRYEALHVDSNTPYVGGQLEARFTLRPGLTVSPFLRVSYSREQAPERRMTASSLAAPGFFWMVEGRAAPEHVMQYDVGLRARFAEGVDFSLKGSRRVWSNGSSSAVELALDSRF